MDFYPVSIIRDKGDISVESMVEILKTVLKGLLEITWPEKLTPQQSLKIHEQTCLCA